MIFNTFIIMCTFKIFPTRTRVTDVLVHMWKRKKKKKTKKHRAHNCQLFSFFIRTNGFMKHHFFSDAIKYKIVQCYFQSVFEPLNKRKLFKQKVFQTPNDIKLVFIYFSGSIFFSYAHDKKFQNFF